LAEILRENGAEKAAVDRFKGGESMTLQILCTLLIIAGLFLLFRIRPSEMTGWLIKNRLSGGVRGKNRYVVSPASQREKMAAAADNAKEMLLAAGMGGQIAAYPLGGGYSGAARASFRAGAG
jgi:predicted lipid-binding transport protein (Tim44 family)